MSKKRIWTPGQQYHILNRGIRKESLFYEPQDCQFFLNLVERTHSKYPFQLTSFCLMNNHYHLQISSNGTEISKIIMYDINKLYARYFNNKYNYRGPVFEGRFTSKPVKDKRGILHLSKYIHFNPVEAKIVKNPEIYLWSSMMYYQPNVQTNIPPYMDLSPVINQFKGSNNQNKVKYIEWCSY
ncbi:REP element-mobilizing transposase RayT [Evansella vedderi]|uniref:REP element-mobilizing transposase RayT n=1 Tax=Evansella vedderi TaxID=38282 RepID=A0ABU0A2M2_9BACI|nr:transposase [Evansella vedderi]MDQ0257201.1 REP element-mobilizing transposase RayT [Evansella vedderi]